MAHTYMVAFGLNPAPLPTTMSFRIQRLLGLHYYTRDLQRTRNLYVEQLGFAEVGRSASWLQREGRQVSLVFRAGDVFFVASEPNGEGGRAARYLAQHPDGVGSLVFEVEDARAAFDTLEHRGATPTGDIVSAHDEHGSIHTFSITTPLSDTHFRFVERKGNVGVFPGMETYDIARSVRNDPGFDTIDHVTVNLRTMKPMLLWLEHVLGFEPFWGVEFHTARAGNAAGSGLKSQVMWDPATSVKLACNEPLRPHFEHSQISAFCAQNRGDGIQHVALGVRDMLRTVRALRARGLAPLPAPSGYYRRLPVHLNELGIAHLDEDLAALEEQGILVDGSQPGSYLLQVFLRDAAGIFSDPEAGPFFLEIIQRKGHAGFGEGNFRALFDSIEQQSVARIA